MPHDHTPDHTHDFDGASPGYRRALLAVIVLNAGLFTIEMTAGALTGSRAQQADALDFGADAATHALSLLVIGLWVLGMALRDALAPRPCRAPK